MANASLPLAPNATTTGTFDPSFDPSFKSNGGFATVHLLSVCIGSTATSKPICYATRSGTVFANGTTLREDGRGTPFEPTGTAVIFGLSLQIGATGISLLGLPWLFYAKWKRQGNWLYKLLLWFGFVGGFIATLAGSIYAMSQSGRNIGGTHDAKEHAIAYKITYHPGWIAMLWLGMIATFFAIGCEHAESNFERFTKKDQEIKRENKPKDVPWLMKRQWSVFWMKRGGSAEEAKKYNFPKWEDDADGKHIFGRV